ncbi:hypothetical protein PSPO01_10100 [Paraphaeosphaeria sporulosa]
MQSTSKQRGGQGRAGRGRRGMGAGGEGSSDSMLWRTERFVVASRFLDGAVQLQHGRMATGRGNPARLTRECSVHVRRILCGFRHRGTPSLSQHSACCAHGVWQLTETGPRAGSASGLSSQLARPRARRRVHHMTLEHVDLRLVNADGHIRRRACSVCTTPPTWLRWAIPTRAPPSVAVHTWLSSHARTIASRVLIPHIPYRPMRPCPSHRPHCEPADWPATTVSYAIATPWLAIAIDVSRPSRFPRADYPDTTDTNLPPPNPTPSLPLLRRPRCGTVGVFVCTRG